jgi:ABC-type branched-subunit amino acid transport system substrate-binding protein
VRSLFATSVALAGCAPTEDAAEDCYWIGSLNPLTGDLGTVGLALENAARLAVQDVNAAGGLATKDLCIATGDTRTDPRRAKVIVDALVQRNDIRAVNGAAESGSTLEAVEATRPRDMALVSCCSTAPDLSKDPYIYRTVPSDALQGVALAQIAAGRRVDRLSVIYLDDPYGTQLRDTFRAAYANQTGGKSPTIEVAYQSGAQSYSNVISSAFGPDPELVLLIAFPLAGAEIIKAWAQSGTGAGVQWLATDGLKDNRFVFLTGGDLPRIDGTAPTPSSPYYAGFEQRYRAAFGGEAPGIFTSNQYDAVILLALAMATAGDDPQPGAIREALPDLSRPGGSSVNAETIDGLRAALDAVKGGQDVDYEGVSGTVDLDANGDVLSPYRLWSIPAGGGVITEEPTCFDCRVGTASTGVTCDAITCM